MLKSMSENKDELIKTQNEVIGILFEIIKRFQANNDLDEEYFQILSKKNKNINQNRLNKILKERKENIKIITKLLAKFD